MSATPAYLQGTTYKRIPNEWSYLKLTKADRHVLEAMVGLSNFNDPDAPFYVGQRLIATMAGVTHKTAWESIQWLVQKGYIEVIPATKGKRQGYRPHFTRVTQDALTLANAKRK